mmetsp:Transcript_64079/g.172191  ORF Transcript_64079/g.172191 Transcript_64079/m.172191 type:complete len:214 (-) Transcript_64079:304-945(-)
MKRSTSKTMSSSASTASTVRRRFVNGPAASEAWRSAPPPKRGQTRARADRWQKKRTSVTRLGQGLQPSPRCWTPPLTAEETPARRHVTVTSLEACGLMTCKNSAAEAKLRLSGSLMGDLGNLLAAASAAATAAENEAVKKAADADAAAAAAAAENEAAKKAAAEMPYVAPPPPPITKPPMGGGVSAKMAVRSGLRCTCCYAAKCKKVLAASAA